MNGWIIMSASNKTKGFVTVATGDIRYYKMAYYLMLTYRDCCGNEKYPFAIIADRENKYTEKFDDVIILKDPSFSWMDKMRILDSCPYHENIFIDADCLLYKNANVFWDVFKGADDFSCFGKALPLDSQAGWFKKDGVADYKINFVTHLHGVLYFIRNTDRLGDFKKVCDDIIQNYSKLTFKYFNDKIADEPIFALAMAIMDFKPIPRVPKYYCFLHAANYVKTDYISKSVEFKYDGEGVINECYIVHWSSENTRKAQYRFEIYKINSIHKNKKFSLKYNILVNKKFKLKQYQMKDKIDSRMVRIKYIIKRIPQKIIGK